LNGLSARPSVTISLSELVDLRLVAKVPDGTSVVASDTAQRLDALLHR
jgi:hypothetical protein